MRELFQTELADLDVRQRSDDVRRCVEVAVSASDEELCAGRAGAPVVALVYTATEPADVSSFAVVTLPVGLHVFVVETSDGVELPHDAQGFVVILPSPRGVDRVLLSLESDTGSSIMCDVFGLSDPLPSGHIECRA